MELERKLPSERVNLRYKIQGTESHSVAEEIGGYVVADNLGNYDKAIRACSSPWLYIIIVASFKNEGAGDCRGRARRSDVTRNAAAKIIKTAKIFTLEIFEKSTLMEYGGEAAAFAVAFYPASKSSGGPIPISYSLLEIPVNQFSSHQKFYSYS
ncbi:hypothetical protein EVAR_33813_1 [Eumeta japonica]|uniref:Uncharacterized protein n=1 Tax=Eumeta variegata TaxID=151549 RepID=A0A4C1V9Z7_EUMVA|nr:hypothetical protein EVAR_33813_1 [Eumeta japonica]